MKKKIVTFLLAFTLTSAMFLTACGNKETDSGKGKTETEATADDRQSKAETESEKVSTEEDTAETTEDVTEEDLQKVYASIKDAITTEYLEPNNISASDFSWPAADSPNWGYIDELYINYAMSSDYSKEAMSYVDNIYTLPERDILWAAFDGIVNFIESEDRESNYWVHLFDRLEPYSETLPENVNF